MTSEQVLERQNDLFVRQGVPDCLRSDDGPEFTARRFREWLERVQVKTLYIEPRFPWENRYIKSLNGKFREKLLNGEIIETLLEARVLNKR